MGYAAKKMCSILQSTVYLKPKIHDTFKKCELNLDQIHEDLIKLTYNYPVEVKVEYDKDKKKVSQKH